MINYYPIKIDKLDTIREQILNVILKYTTLDKTKFFYIPVQEIFEIEELRSQIENIGLLNHIEMAGINIFAHSRPSIIHKDAGNFIYSLNIPIIGYEQTYLNFFESTAEPERRYTQTFNHEYDYYPIRSCTLIERVETTTPAIVNTHAIHAFDNFKSSTRVVLLLRINKNANSSIWYPRSDSN